MAIIENAVRQPHQPVCRNFGFDRADEGFGSLSISASSLTVIIAVIIGVTRDYQWLSRSVLELVVIARPRRTVAVAVASSASCTGATPLPSDEQMRSHILEYLYN